MAKNRFSSGDGPSQRQLRVGELIRRTLSDVLMRGDVHDPDLNRISITVGEVRTSPDLKVATAYVAPAGGHGWAGRTRRKCCWRCAVIRVNCAIWCRRP